MAFFQFPRSWYPTGFAQVLTEASRGPWLPGRELLRGCFSWMLGSWTAFILHDSLGDHSSLRPHSFGLKKGEEEKKD
jgi:hypothetical protein